jgi:dihydropteroate synthase
MGIVNVTPDSFSDGGKYYSKEKAIVHALNLLDDGADILDIGGESTRPDAEKVSIESELERVIPVIQDLVRVKPDVIISIDTTKSIVAEECIKVGARLINDISGGTFDDNMFSISSKYDVPYILMHIKDRPENMQKSPYYENVISEIINYFEERIEIARKNEVIKLILDPGIGFGKRIEDNYEILNSFNDFNKLGYPLLVGVSKKSFLGKSLNLNINNRENSTIIAETIAVQNGAKIVRTHNVKNAIELKKIVSFTRNNNTVINV